MKEMTPQEFLRRKLPGFKQETLMAANKDRELWHVLDIRGCFDELIDASCYQIRQSDGVCTCYGTIEQARAAWA